MTLPSLFRVLGGGVRQMFGLRHFLGYLCPDPTFPAEKTISKKVQGRHGHIKYVYTVQISGSFKSGVDIRGLLCGKKVQTITASHRNYLVSV